MELQLQLIQAALQFEYIKTTFKFQLIQAAQVAQFVAQKALDRPQPSQVNNESKT